MTPPPVSSFASDRSYVTTRLMSFSSSCIVRETNEEVIGSQYITFIVFLSFEPIVLLWMEESFLVVYFQEKVLYA
jgi:hypothetical protein